MEERNKKRNPTRTGEGGIDGDPMQEKRKGEESSNPVVNTKSAPPKGKPSPLQIKNKQPTSNIQNTLRNQRRKFTNLLIDIFPLSSFNGIVALPPPSSFIICQYCRLQVVVLVVVVLVDALVPPACPRAAEGGGT